MLKKTYDQTATDTKVKLEELTRKQKVRKWQSQTTALLS